MRRFRSAAALLLWLGTTWPASAAQIQVSSGGSITDGLAAASPGDTVCVQGGTYFEQVTLVPGVTLLGGFDASFGPRDPAVHVTTIHGEGVRSCIVSGAGADSATVVDGFALRGGGGVPGAALRVTGGSPLFSNNDISENRRAGIAGGVYISGGSTARFVGNEFRDNSSAGSGGAVRIEGSSPTFSDNLLDGNVAQNSGGGFYVFDSILTCTATTIRNGRAGNGGGAAFSFQECPPGGEISGTIIEDCEAGHGGAIYIRDESTLLFRSTTIRGCSATAASGGYGGGAFVQGFSDVTFEDARFENCSATASGGGLYSFRSTLEVSGTDASSTSSTAAFVNCSADRRGGGLWVFQAQDTTHNRVTDVRFSDCSARDEGGGFYFAECALLFVKNLVERCTGGNGGGGTILTTATVSPPRTILANNTFYECSSTLDPATNPAGGLAVLGPNNSNLALIAGSIISHTVSGSAISCVGGPGEAQPTIVCSTFYLDPGNTSDLAGGNRCNLAFQAGAGNANRDPGFCSTSPTVYALKDCNLETNCPDASSITMLVNRGVTDTVCPCAISAVEESSWGQIKARYRR